MIPSPKLCTRRLSRPSALLRVSSIAAACSTLLMPSCPTKSPVGRQVQCVLNDQM